MKEDTAIAIAISCVCLMATVCITAETIIKVEKIEAQKMETPAELIVFQSQSLNFANCRSNLQAESQRLQHMIAKKQGDVQASQRVLFAVEDALRELDGATEDDGT